eukprot:jgi/Botrbrau1/8127/Bobra.0308s0019.1
MCQGTIDLSVVMGPPVLEPTTEAAKAYRGPHGCNIFLDQAEMHIGRNPALNPTNINLPVHWAQVSAKHCIITISDGKWLVTDTSSNGTFINGIRLEKGVPHSLKFGDTLGLASHASKGLYEYKFRESDLKEALALRIPKPNSNKRAVPTPGLDSESLLKKPKLGGIEAGRALPHTDGTPNSDLASALFDLQRQNQAERARRTEEQTRREDAERKLREVEVAHAAERERFEAEVVFKLSAERRVLEEQLAQTKAEEAAVRELMAKKEEELGLARSRAAEQQDQISKQSTEILALQESLRAATSVSEQYKTLLEEEKAQCSILQKELVETRELVTDRTLQHVAAVEVVESQKQKLGLLQDKILELQEDLQSKIRSVQSSRDAQAEAQDLLKVKTAFLHSASTGFGKLADALVNQRQLVEHAQQALNAVIASSREVQTYKDGVMQIFHLVAPDVNERPGSHSDIDHTVGTKINDEVSMATQECGHDDEDRAAESNAKKPMEAERDCHATIHQESQLGPASSLALTLKEAAYQDEGPEALVLPAPIAMGDSQVHLPNDGVIMGAQPHSISFMVESTNPTVASGRDGFTAQEAHPSHGAAEESEESSGIASDSTSGDENADMSNSIDRPLEPPQSSNGFHRPARYFSTSPLKVSFAKTSISAGPTLAESELDGMV